MRAGSAPAPPARCLGGNRPGGRGALGPIGAPVRARRIRALLDVTPRCGPRVPKRSISHEIWRRLRSPSAMADSDPGRSCPGPCPPNAASSLTGRRSRHVDLPPVNKNAGVCRRLVRHVCKLARAANEATTNPIPPGRVPRSSPRSATPTSSLATICSRSSGAPRGETSARSSRRSPRRRCAATARWCGSEAGRARSAGAGTSGRCGGRAACRGPRRATSPTATRRCS
jgi:hypothetical protein